MQRWIVVLDKGAAKDLRKLPKEIVEILDQLRHDLEAEGPTPKGWLLKHVQGRSGVYAARLKREYRAVRSGFAYNYYPHRCTPKGGLLICHQKESLIRL